MRMEVTGKLGTHGSARYWVLHKRTPLQIGDQVMVRVFPYEGNPILVKVWHINDFCIFFEAISVRTNHGNRRTTLENDTGRLE